MFFQPSLAMFDFLLASFFFLVSPGPDTTAFFSEKTLILKIPLNQNNYIENINVKILMLKT